MFEEIKKMLVEELEVDEAIITPEASFAADLGINSIEMADFALMCEDKYDITISDDDVNTFITINDVVNYLEARK